MSPPLLISTEKKETISNRAQLIDQLDDDVSVMSLPAGVSNAFGSVIDDEGPPTLSRGERIMDRMKSFQGLGRLQRTLPSQTLLMFAEQADIVCVPKESAEDDGASADDDTDSFVNELYGEEGKDAVVNHIKILYDDYEPKLVVHPNQRKRLRRLRFRQSTVGQSLLKFRERAHGLITHKSSTTEDLNEDLQGDLDEEQKRQSPVLGTDPGGSITSQPDFRSMERQLTNIKLELADVKTEVDHSRDKTRRTEAERDWLRDQYTALQLDHQEGQEAIQEYQQLIEHLKNHVHKMSVNQSVVIDGSHGSHWTGLSQQRR